MTANTPPDIAQMIKSARDAALRPGRTSSLPEQTPHPATPETVAGSDQNSLTPPNTNPQSAGSPIEILASALMAVLGAPGSSPQSAPISPPPNHALPAPAPARPSGPPPAEAQSLDRNAVIIKPAGSAQQRLRATQSSWRNHPVRNSLGLALSGAAVTASLLNVVKGMSLTDMFRVSAQAVAGVVGGESQPSSLVFPSMDCTQRLATISVKASGELHWLVNRALSAEDVAKKNADGKVTIQTEHVELGKVPLAPIGIDPKSTTQKIERYPEIVLEESMVIKGCDGVFTPQGNSLVTVKQSSIGLSATTDTSPAATTPKKEGYTTFKIIPPDPKTPSLFTKEEIDRLNKLTDGNDPRVRAAFRLAVLQEVNDRCGVEIRQVAKASINTLIESSAVKQGYPGITIIWDVGGGDFQTMAEMYKKNVNTPPVNPPPYTTSDASFGNINVTCGGKS